MAQLTDDCFAFSGPLLPVEEVERIIRERVTPVAEIETVALHAASGRVMLMVSALLWVAAMAGRAAARVSAALAARAQSWERRIVSFPLRSVA